MIRSTTPNTQWWWVARMIILHCHQWRSSKKDLMNGLKVKAATHFVIVFAFFNQQILLLGPPLPEPLAYHQMLSWDTNLVVLGGRSSLTSWSSSLYHLECKDGVFTWKTMETKMSKARQSFVAFQVPDDFISI